MVTAYGAVPKVLGVPVWYFPRVRTDATDPLGPFVGAGFGQNRIFGTQFYTTWDMFDLLALKPPPGHRWRLDLDYLSKRGPAVGTDYIYQLPSINPGAVRHRWAHQALRHQRPRRRHPRRRPRAAAGRSRNSAAGRCWRHQQEIIEGLYFQGQVAYLSDKNFLEQYYK